MESWHGPSPNSEVPIELVIDGVTIKAITKADAELREVKKESKIKFKAGDMSEKEYVSILNDLQDLKQDAWEKVYAKHIIK